MGYQIKVITGENHNRRGVAFLISDNRKVNAHNFFYGLRGEMDNETKNIDIMDGTAQNSKVLILTVLSSNTKKTDFTVFCAIRKQRTRVINFVS